jgi:uncharacterized protein YjbJ (UPF0337 family)
MDLYTVIILLQINSFKMTETSKTLNPIKGNWSEQKTKLKAKFSNLTDADLQYENGKKDEMLTKIHVKLGKTKEELASIIAAL